MYRRNYNSLNNYDNFKSDFNPIRRKFRPTNDKSGEVNDDCPKDFDSCMPNQSPKSTIYDEQLPSRSRCSNDLHGSGSSMKPVSNETNSNLVCKDYIKTHDTISSDLCDYWDKSEEASSRSHFKQNNQKQMLTVEPNTSPTTAEDEHQISNAFSEMTREEILMRRKLKVLDLRKKKKLEKQQLTLIKPDFEVNNETQHLSLIKPDFDVNNMSEDFPDLTTARNNRRKFRHNRYDNSSETESHIEVNKHNTGTEKSWKPKVKDPISIDICQALQTKSEKVKVITKKTDPTAQRNVVKGNILDSDSPQLKKGKVRPDKQRKPTKLKKQILLERNERRIQCEQVENFNVPVISQNDCYTNVDDKDVIDQQLGKNTDAPFSDSSDEVSNVLSKCTLLEIDKNSSSNNNGKDLINQEDFKKCDILRTIHSRKFREYCTNCITEEVISSVCALLEKLAYFQDRTFARDPIKAQAKRRYVAGINQISKYLMISNKVKLLVIAPDLERNSREGGLDNIIQNFKNEADIQNIPYIFGPKRNRLGKAVFKKALVSCVAVLSYEGAEEQFSRVLNALDDAKLKYQAVTNGDSNSTDKNVIKQPNPITVVDEDFISADKVTSSLLAVLKEDLSPSDKLLSAIHKSGCSNIKKEFNCNYIKRD